MAEIPTIEPTQFRAGDTVKWIKSLADYPASAGWTLKYRLINSAAKYDITASASGDDHSVTVAASASALYTAGSYQWQAYVEKGSERYTVGTGTIDVLVNLAGLSAAYDTRSHVKKTLDAIEAAIEAIDKGVLSYTISVGGSSRTFTKRNFDELIKLRSLYKSEYTQELAAERVAKGLDSGRRVGVRFRRV